MKGSKNRRQDRFYRAGVCILSAILFILLVPSPSQGVEAGFVFGPGVEWIGGRDWKNDLSSDGMSDSHSTDFLYGLFLRAPLVQWGRVSFHLRPEVQLMTPRGQGSSSTKDLDVFAKVLHFPLSFEVRYPLEFGALYGFAGPSLNLFLTEIEYQLESADGVEKDSQTPYYGVVVGALLGAGYVFPFPAFSIQFEVRYTQTLSLVLKDKDTTFGGFYILLGASAPFHL